VQMGYGGGNGGSGGKRQSVGSFCESPVESRSPEANGMHMERKEPFEIVISQCELPFLSLPVDDGLEGGEDQG
jgi:hypothetical protein